MNIATVKQYLRNHPRADLIQYIIRKKLPFAEACREMVSLEKDPLVVKFKHYGNLHKGIIIYHIYFGARGEEKTGYCALLKHTLLHMAYADRMGFTPVVEWANTLPYTEEQAIHGKKNGFEYFLENASGLAIEDIYQSDLVVEAKGHDKFLIYDFSMEIGSYGAGKREIEIAAKMYAKYIRFNQKGMKAVVKPANELLGKGACLGVHVRGTDFNKQYCGHPKQIPAERFVKQAQAMLASQKYQYIFLATDEVRIVKMFREEFGEKLLFYDVLRSKDGNAVHYEMASTRQHNKYYLGMEILKDVYTLGHCDALLAGTSSVAFIAQVIKKSTGIAYLDKIIIDEGVNQNLHLFR